jgi:hypothetical protein
MHRCSCYRSAIHDDCLLGLSCLTLIVLNVISLRCNFGNSYSSWIKWAALTKTNLSMRAMQRCQIHSEYCQLVAYLSTCPQ